VIDMERPTRALIPLLAIPALLLAACASAGSPTSAPPDAAGKGGGAPAIAYGPAVPAPIGATDVQRSTAAGSDQQTKPQPIPVPQAFDTERALILTASVSMRSKDAWTVSDRVQSIALALGGDVMSLAQAGSSDQRSATLTIRVPQGHFNDALRQIREITDVEVVSSNVDGKDVTEQFVDLQARLKAKQAEEQRYLGLLARADKIDDILKIDAVLAQVRTQIEQLTGQVNSIKARTTFSNITVQVSPLMPQPVPTLDPKAYDPSKTLERAVAALASLMRVGLDFAIWGLVFGWIPLMVLGLAVLVTRTRPRVAPSA
jgi:hypothetical protein